MRDCALAHLFRGERGVAGDPFDEHALQCTAPVSLTLQALE